MLEPTALLRLQRSAGNAAAARLVRQAAARPQALGATALEVQREPVEEEKPQETQSNETGRTSAAASDRDAAFRPGGVGGERLSGRRAGGAAHTTLGRNRCRRCGRDGLRWIRGVAAFFRSRRVTERRGRQRQRRRRRRGSGCGRRGSGGCGGACAEWRGGTGGT